MKTSYFKPRKPFSFSPHPFDLGTFMGLWDGHDDNHFLLKIYRMEEKKFPDYYIHHQNYALENNLDSEEDFFRHVLRIVQNRIKHYELQDPFSRNHAMHRNSVQKLQQFQKYLNRIDQWNARPSHIVIAEKEELIQKQKEEIEKLTARLSELNEYEVLQKISIEDNALPTLVDLLKQMSRLTLPSGRNFLACDKKSPYSKMISKYFSQDGKDIPLETSRNYFVEKKGEIPIKGTTVRKEHQIFEIIPVTELKK
ncbi:hypothetical protein [Pedobacter nyackensis]|uniref:Uncharacterized protein n=1 Tax=Pedobacter nyackensis TaxID=475255 RepID=A0A1W2F2V7_9SPHI|nr:hypothetical protein [Pedobacter nyackensis]SMD16271.1 hypothetical protein SAMN04488101_11966 [Pedobacter nyackensis]